jgi:uncharacterized protein YjbI with pentapeptide repeats
MSEQKTCFIIAPIGEPDSETRKRSDQIFDHVITPAVNECGYEPLRADKIAEPGLITHQIIQHIVEAPLVIADLTNQNPNVFYELAIRHALKKPLVQIIKKGEPIPFDVAATRTIHVDHHDLDSVAEAKTEIIRQIKSLEEGVEFQTPISVALDLQMLSHSEDPESQSIVEILQAVYDLRSSVSALHGRFEELEAFVDTAKKLAAQKAALIEQMGSSAQSVAIAAAERLSGYGWLSDGSLRGADLSGANLQGAFLFKANLEGVHLQGATLIGANLRRANMLGVRLQGADLSGANLQEAFLVHVSFRDARLSEANLQGARMIQAHLEEADLLRANLRGAQLSSAYLQGANLQGADLSGANLQGADLFKASLEGAHF